jgi:hypothetical protein
MIRIRQLVPSVIIGGALASILAGCDGTGADPSQDLPSQNSPAKDSSGGQAEVFQRTIVVKQADGTETVSQFNVTQKERDQDLALHELYLQGKVTPAIPPSRIVRDWGCGTSSMWMFTGTGYSGAEICFYLVPGNTMNYINIGYYSWAQHIRSFKAGSQRGAFFLSTGCAEVFNAWQLTPSASACVRSADSITFFQ